MKFDMSDACDTFCGSGSILKLYSFGSLNPTMVCVEKRATSSPPPFFGIGWVAPAFNRSHRIKTLSVSVFRLTIFLGEKMQSAFVTSSLSATDWPSHHMERNQISFWIIDALKWLYLNFHKLLVWDLRGPRCVALESSRFCPLPLTRHMCHIWPIANCYNYSMNNAHVRPMSQFFIVWRIYKI